MAERVRFRRRTQRREHADRAPEPGPLQRDVPHVVVRRAVLPMSRMALPRDDDHPQIRTPGRTRPASFPRRRRIALPGSPATSDIELACLPRPAAPHAPRTRRRSPPRSPEPEPPPAPTRSRAAHRPDSLERPRRPPRPRPPVPAEGRTRRTRPATAAASEEPFRYEEKRSVDEAGVLSAAARSGAWDGWASGARPPPPPHRASAPDNPSSDATRGGAPRPITAASGAM